MYAATGGPNVKWGDTDFKWGPGTTGPPAGDGPAPKAVCSASERQYSLLQQVKFKYLNILRWYSRVAEVGTKRLKPESRGKRSSA